jgi:hypothetical protein
MNMGLIGMSMGLIGSFDIEKEGLIGFSTCLLEGGWYLGQPRQEGF